MTQKPMPRKRDFGELKSKKFPGEACACSPLEACAFRRCLFRNSVSIYYRSEPGQVFIRRLFNQKNIENCFFFTPLIFRAILNKKMESKKGYIVFKRLYLHLK